MYGITGGLGTGFVTFMGTSRPALSAHVTMGTFMSVTMIYWFTCRFVTHCYLYDLKSIHGFFSRYQFSKTRFEMHQMQRAMRERVAIEGTAREKKFLAGAKEA